MMKLKMLKSKKKLKHTLYQCREIVAVWLDGTDITNEGKWVWYTTGQPIGYFNWSPGQPDHYFGVHRENCMDYGPEYNMQWNDAPCHNNSRKHNVLCEGGSVLYILGEVWWSV